MLKDFTKSNFEYSEENSYLLHLVEKRRKRQRESSGKRSFCEGRQQYNWSNYDKAKKLLEADSLDNNDQSILYL